jgi:hypothetical protein
MPQHPARTADRTSDASWFDTAIGGDSGLAHAAAAVMRLPLSDAEKAAPSVGFGELLYRAVAGIQRWYAPFTLIHRLPSSGATGIAHHPSLN